MISYVVNDNFISLVIDNKPYNVNKTHKNFEKIKSTLKDKDVIWNYGNVILDLISEVETIKQKMIKFPGIKVTDSNIFYNDEPLDGSLVNQILKTKDQGFEFDNLVKFLENLMDNTSEDVRNELYDWIKSSGNISITCDGAFLAYKKVRNDYYDIYSGKMLNSIGSVLEVEEVDTDRTRTCSYGLHFCSYDYLKHYGDTSNSRVVIVKIFPQDVIAIPVDYNFQKGRCKRYEVVGEVSDFNSGHSLDKCVDDYSDSDNVSLMPNFNGYTTSDMTKLYNEYWNKNIKHLKTKTDAIKQMKRIFDLDPKFFK